METIGINLLIMRRQNVQRLFSVSTKFFSNIKKIYKLVSSLYYELQNFFLIYDYDPFSARSSEAKEKIRNDIKSTVPLKL